MKVKKLIEELKKFPFEMDVYMECCELGWHGIGGVTVEKDSLEGEEETVIIKIG